VFEQSEGEVVERAGVELQAALRGALTQAGVIVQAVP
jgi:hypothetical protein